jgi:hypothetical protein
MVPVAVPLVGETCSQLPPVTDWTDTLNPVLPPVAVSVIVCDGNAVVEPCASVNVSLTGDTATVVLDETINTTGIVTAPLGRVALLFALIVIDPV